MKIHHRNGQIWMLYALAAVGNNTPAIQMVKLQRLPTFNLMKTNIFIRMNNPSMDEIIFENRNQDYGAYALRKNYHKNLVLSLCLTSCMIFSGMLIAYF